MRDGHPPPGWELRLLLAGGCLIAALSVALVTAACGSQGGSTHQLSGPNSHHHPKARSTFYVAGTGSDENRGTLRHPWRTIARAGRSVRAGDTVYVEPGTYGREFPHRRTVIRASGTPEKPISWVAVPGSSQPIFRGSLRVEGAWNRVSGMLFEGPSGTIKENGGREDVLVWLNGNGDRLDHCEVRGSAGHAGVFVSHSEGFSIDHDYIHNNGVTYNLDHGVYVSSAEASGKIEANVIARNYAWGVHLYPEVSGVLVDHNTIVENGRGGVIVANASARNRIDENIVADNREYGIRGYELTGTGNEATDNLLWNQPFETTGAGMTFRENIVADPQFVGPGDFHLQGNSPAIGAGHSGGGFDIEGNGRGTPSDLGAYEFLGPSE